jgi:hypothetical protein
VRDTGGRVSLAVYDCKKPVIAAINGAAVGIGATMTLPMDVRLASDKARIGFVFGKHRHRARGLQHLVPAAHRGPAAGAGLGLCGRHPDGRAGAGRPAGEGGGAGTSSCWPRRMRWRTSYIDGRSPVSIALMRQMLLRNHAMPHPRDAHAVESLAMLHTSRQRRQVKAWPVVQ